MVDKPMIVERNNERILWRLTAEKANTDANNIMYLTRPVLELLTEAGEVIPVHGREAWYDPEKKNIQFKGQVQVTHQDWVLRSETLRYESKTDIADIPGTFHMQGVDSQMRGRGLKINRKTQRLHIYHDVWLEDARKNK